MTAKSFYNKTISLLLILTFIFTSNVYPFPYNKDSMDTLRVQHQLKTREGQERYTKAFLKNISRRDFMKIGKPIGLAIMIGGVAYTIADLAGKFGIDEKEAVKRVEKVHRFIELFKSSSDDSEMFYARKLLQFTKSHRNIMMTAISSECEVTSFPSASLPLKLEYEYYSRDHFLGKLLRVISEKSENRTDDLNKLGQIIREGIETFDRGKWILYTGIINHALLASAGIDEDYKKEELYEGVEILLSSYRDIRDSGLFSRTMIDFLANIRYWPEPVRLDIIKYVAGLGLTFGDNAAISAIKEALERIYGQDSSRDVRMAAKDKLEYIEGSKREAKDAKTAEKDKEVSRREKQESLNILKGDSVDLNIVRPAVVQGSAGVESAPDAHRLRYEGPDNWGFVRFDFNEAQDLTKSTTEIEVEGVPGKERIKEFGITLVHEGRGMHRLPVHINDIDVSKDGVVRVSIPENIEGVDLTKVETILIHICEEFDYRKTTFRNSKGAEILVKSINIIRPAKIKKGLIGAPAIPVLKRLKARREEL